MKMARRFALVWFGTIPLLFTALAHAGPAADALPASALQLSPSAAAASQVAAVPNAAFAPGADALPAQAFAGELVLDQATLHTQPMLAQPVVLGRDARRFPAVRLAFFTLGDHLVPVQRGRIVAELPGARPASYWAVIPQFGRVWREPADGGWSRAAFPLMLVNDTENHAHQGLATFLYRNGEVSALRFQFVQQTAPYLVHPQFVAWGLARALLRPVPAQGIAAWRAAAQAELDARLPARPLAELLAALPHDELRGFGGPLHPNWIVQVGLLRGGVLYYGGSATPFGPYPYPLEMRFGVRSVMKSVGAPLALLRLAEVYGPYVLQLRIGDYVAGLDDKYRDVRFIDAANMATGFGGTGSMNADPNDFYDGYLGGDYDSWYTEPSALGKIKQIRKHLRPYPWPPGTVLRYRDQDFFLLGAALDAFLKSKRGPRADLWEMLEHEVFEPIGIFQAPAVRTREAGGRIGLVWLSAGYYPTLDDLAKIALLYQAHGAHAGVQLLHRTLTDDWLAGRGALALTAHPAQRDALPDDAQLAGGLYRMGAHFEAYTALSGRRYWLPVFSGSGENQVVLYPNGDVSLRMAKADGLSTDAGISDGDADQTWSAVDRLDPF